MKKTDSRSFGLFAPPMRTVRMKYATHVSINSASGLVAYHVFRANGIYDPDTTGIGHQPSFYDQCAAIYNHYRVVASRIKASFVNNGAGATICATVGVKLDDDGSGSAVLSDLLEEQVGVDHKLFRMDSVEGVSTVSMSYKQSEFFGSRTPDTTALFGADPTEQAYFNIFVGPTDETTEIGPLLVQVEIEYDVECSELKDLTPSNSVLLTPTKPAQPKPSVTARPRH